MCPRFESGMIVLPKALITALLQDSMTTLLQELMPSLFQELMTSLLPELRTSLLQELMNSLLQEPMTSLLQDLIAALQQKQQTYFPQQGTINYTLIRKEGSALTNLHLQSYTHNVQSSKLNRNL